MQIVLLHSNSTRSWSRFLLILFVRCVLCSSKWTEKENVQQKCAHFLWSFFFYLSRVLFCVLSVFVRTVAVIMCVFTRNCMYKASYVSRKPPPPPVQFSIKNLLLPPLPIQLQQQQQQNSREIEKKKPAKFCVFSSFFFF